MNNDIEKFYIENRHRLLKRCERVSPSWGEDILHNAFELALKYYDAEEVRELPNWFSTLLTNCIRDWINTEKGRYHTEFDEFAYVEDVPDIIDSYLIKEIHKRIKKIGRENHREVLTMYFIKQYPIKDISLLTSAPYSTCSSIVDRFKVELRDCYEEVYRR